MGEHTKFLIKHLHPVMKDGLECDALSDPESHVDVGPCVPSPKRHGAGERATGDPWVGLRQFQDTIAHVIPALYSEHIDLSCLCEEYYHSTSRIVMQSKTGYSLCFPRIYIQTSTMR